jgi:hypothetical protein
MSSIMFICQFTGDIQIDCHFKSPLKCFKWQNKYSEYLHFNMDIDFRGLYSNMVHTL